MTARALILVLAGCGSVPESSEAPQSPDVLTQAIPMLRNADQTTWGPLETEERVWTVDHLWEDVTPEAGLAWPNNSGMNWEDKYHAWIESLTITSSVDNHDTALLTTPWGDTLPLNRMECAESAIMLRATFAAWHNLPFFMVAYSPALGENVYYGHFGMVDFDGEPIPGALNFDQWTDHTDSYYGGAWPSDPYLATASLPAVSDDDNGFLGPNAYTGAYLDEIHLNKKAGHFLLRLLTDFGSIHLSRSDNLYDLQPQAVDAGDLLIHRWQPQGIGHTMVIKEVDRGLTHAEITLLQGSMPRIQPKWTAPAISRAYFTSSYAGSNNTNSDGTPYVEFGGGLKRWRSATLRNGRWANGVATQDVPDFIDPDDDQVLGDRVLEFATWLQAPSPQAERDALLAAIDAARDNLSRHPSSCANRERRERAFEDLYDHMQSAFGMSRAEVDAAYRTLDDYVFPELAYSSSPSCCWNSTTPEMYDAIMDYTLEEQVAAEAANTCVEPQPFVMEYHEYDTFETHASSMGITWVPWSADETCPQAGAPDDVISQAPFTPWCDLEAAAPPAAQPDNDGGGGGGGGCSSNAWQGYGAIMLAGLVLGVRRERD